MIRKLIVPGSVTRLVWLSGLPRQVFMSSGILVNPTVCTVPRYYRIVVVYPMREGERCGELRNDEPRPNQPREITHESETQKQNSATLQQCRFSLHQSQLAVNGVLFLLHPSDFIREHLYSRVASLDSVMLTFVPFDSIAAKGAWKHYIHYPNPHT
jgi:hypothetical protein